MIIKKTLACIALAQIFLCALFSEEGVLYFEDAVDRIFACSPELRMRQSQVQQFEGDRIQSAAYPNPTLSYSVENVFGTHHWRGWKSAENRVEYVQPVLLGCKREKRMRAADYQLFSAQARYDRSVLSVMNRLRKAFLNVAAAQVYYQLVQEQCAMSKQVLDAVILKFESGKASTIQKKKAEIAFMDATINVGKASVDLIAAKESLALFWGASEADFDYVDFPFFEIVEPPPLDICIENLETHPEIVESQFEYMTANQIVRIENAARIPDLLVILGYKSIQNCSDRGMIIGATMPLPIFDTNRGKIYRAKAAAQESYQQQLQLQQLLQNKLSLAHRELMRAYQEVSRYETDILTAAAETFQFAIEGYQEGKFEYLEMLDAQRTLFEVRERHIQALVNYQEKLTDIEFLSSQDL